MSNLISRQAVIDIIHNEIERTTSFSEHETQINIEMAVKGLPVAYDVDKVVAELEEFEDEAKQFGVSGMVADMIDVVRKGGVE